MDTATDNRCGSPGRRMPTAAVISLVAAGWMAGCGELPAHDSLSAQEAPMRMLDNCPAGVCTGTGNGRGIYVAELSSYCFLAPDDPRYFFCPEGFSNQPEWVELTGQRIDKVEGFPTTPMNVSYIVSALWKGQKVNVASISTVDTVPFFKVRDGSSLQTIEGSELDALVLERPKGNPLFQMRFHAPQKEGGVILYQVEYLLNGGSQWQPYCADGEGLAAILPERKVHSVTARVTSSTSDFTMACRTGAIATCMVWGYGPWGAGGGEKQALADSLYGSCLQAKRAAYFVGQGDYASYTVKGTQIAIQDEAGIMDVLMPGVEAVWSPEGATCLSPEFRRIPPEDADPLPPLPKNNPLPPCDEELHKAAATGELRALLKDTAPFATGSAP